MSPLDIFSVKNKAIQMLIKVVVVIIILLIIYKMYMTFSDKIKAGIRNRKIEKDLKHIVDQQGNDLNGQVSQNVKTYTNADYKLMAESLFEAMEGAGTDENSIFTIISSLRTKADWYALADAFGTRKTSSMWSSFEGTLTKWLADELDDDEKQRVNNTLSKFGVGRI